MRVSEDLQRLAVCISEPYLLLPESYEGVNPQCAEIQPYEIPVIIPDYFEPRWAAESLQIQVRALFKGDEQIQRDLRKLEVKTKPLLEELEEKQKAFQRIERAGVAPGVMGVNPEVEKPLIERLSELEKLLEPDMKKIQELEEMLKAHRATLEIYQSSLPQFLGELKASQAQAQELPELNPKQLHFEEHKVQLVVEYLIQVAFPFLGSKGGPLATWANNCLKISGTTVIGFLESCIDKTIVFIPRIVRGTKISEISDGAFAEKNIRRLFIEPPEWGLLIGNYAFGNNQLTELHLPSGVKLGISVFARNRIQKLTLEEGLREIPQGTFYDNQISQVEIPRSVRSIGIHAFQENPMTAISLPPSCSYEYGKTEIGRNSFDPKVVVSRN
jgi:uncharacterized coiled-coil protein SlyX